MTNTLQTLIEEARTDFLGLCPVKDCEACEKDGKIIEKIVTQAFTAGEAKGRDETVNEVWDWVHKNSSHASSHPDSDFAKMLEATRQGDKEREV